MFGAPFNPRPTKEGGYHPLDGLSPAAKKKNAKESDTGHLEHLFYILCRHFDEKNRGYPIRWG